MDTQDTIDIENFVNLDKTIDQVDNNSESDRNFDENETPLDEGGSCSLADCKNPIGDLKWVQCMKCLSWCHYLCVNIPDSKEFEKEEQYLCPPCLEKPNSNTFEGFSNQSSECPPCLEKSNSNTFEGFSSQSSEQGSGGLETFTPIESNTVQRDNETLKRKAKTKAKQNVKDWINMQ